MKRMKYIFACAIVMLVASFGVHTAVRAETDALDEAFSDVANVSEDLREAILRLTLSGAIHGYQNGTFRPNATISRKEFIKLVVTSVLSKEDKHDSTLDLALRRGDIDKIISAAQTRKLLDQFVANADLSLPITRAEAVLTIIAAYKPDLSKEPIASSRFVDVLPGNGDLARYVEFLVNQQIVKGRDDRYFEPSATTTRAEAAKLAYLVQRAFTDEDSDDTENDEQDDEDSEVSVSTYNVKIVNIVPRSLIAGDDSTVLFSVLTRRGDPISGLGFGDNIIANVVKSQAQIVSTEELGSGLYALGIHIPDGAPPGPICINIILLGAGGSQASTCDWTPPEEEPESTNSGRVSLVRIIPTNLSVGQEATILATPRDHKGNQISGLTLIAQIVKGSAEITQQMTESPLGSGVYVGTMQAALVPSEVEVRVRIEGSPSGANTTVTATVGY